MRHKKIKTAFSAKKIESRVKDLAKDIRKDAGKDEVFLLGILKGATCFLADLMRVIPGQVRYGYIDVVRDISDTEIATALEIDFLSHNNEINGRHVYLLKDVVMTGVIENYLLTQLRQHNPKALKLVALLDRPEGRRVDLSVDFRAFTVKEGSYVGYGLDLDGRYSNLPYIGRL
jgi:hypoxanthine phosphoribosyltransferase